MILALTLLPVMGAEAQPDAGGRTVKRITFDREQVSVVYSDNTKEVGVRQLTVKRDRTTGLVSVKPSQGAAARQWYTIDGRPLQKAPQQKGIYIVKDKNGVKKTSKK